MFPASLATACCTPCGVRRSTWSNAVSPPPADVDRVARLTFGLRMPAVGPLENIDLVGLDLVETIHQYVPADLCNDPGPLPLLTQMKKRGPYFPRLGTARHGETARTSRPSDRPSTRFPGRRWTRCESPLSSFQRQSLNAASPCCGPVARSCRMAWKMPTR